MKKSSTLTSSFSSKLEHFADVMTHGLGLFLSVIGFMILAYQGAHTNDVWRSLTTLVYGVSLVSAYFSSTMYHLYLYYHRVPNKKFRRLLLLFDHCSIFLLIAGTNTPILLVYLRNWVGWSLFSLIWLLTILGIIYKLLYIGRFKRFSLVMYSFMGWLLIVALKDLLHVLPLPFIYLLFIGGAFYTIGIIFFQYTKLPFNHAIWHVFVLIGSLVHYLAIILYVV